MTVITRSRALAAVLALGAQMLWASSASAAYITLTAEAVCTPAGVAVINYRATSFTTDPAWGENSLIQISLNNIPSDSGEFSVANGFTFTGSLPAPGGSEAIVTATAIDDWGNGSVPQIPGGQSTSITVELPTGCTSTVAGGRFTGGGFQLRGGDARVTRGFTIHCDLLLSNNLEVNWGGNKFHMTEHLRTVVCSDDPLINQAPPRAPLDTLVGVGTGRYNGVDGFTIEFTLVDYGEPGRFDRAALRIYQTSNPANVVLNVPLQTLSGGNLQAHYDQPHKR